MPPKGKPKRGKTNDTPTNDEDQTTHANEAEDQASVPFIEGIDDQEEDVRANLPSQDHCTWLLNIIRIHAKKMAKEVLQEHENTKLAQLKQEVCDMKKANEQMQNKLVEFQDEISKLKRSRDGINRELAKKTNELEKLKQHMDSIDQKQREQRVRITGITEEDGEDLTKKVVKLAKNKLGVKKINGADIVQIHRSGKKKATKTRDIIVQFENKATRDLFHGARKKLYVKNDGKSSVYINDDLTDFRQKLLYDARMLVRRKKLKAAWAQCGNVMVLMDQGGPHAVYNYQELRIHSGMEYYDDVSNDVTDQLDDYDTGTMSDCTF